MPKAISESIQEPVSETTWTDWNQVPALAIEHPTSTETKRVTEVWSLSD